MEKSVQDIDNLWVTIDGYQPPQSQSEWEETCFLDKSYHGYYFWPKILQYPMNKRERYSSDDMPEEVIILYDRFNDRSFLQQIIELMLLDEVEDEDLEFSEIRFAMYKVKRKCRWNGEGMFSRVYFGILVLYFSSIFSNNYSFLFERKAKKNK